MPASYRVLFSWRILVNFFLGISSGLPLLMTASTLQAWMTDEKVDLEVIGLFSLVGLPYILKFLWAPFMDRYVPPFLGRRRGWILITQLLLGISVAILSFISPGKTPGTVALLAVLIAFFSASQDIVFDAYRREILKDEELGLGNSMAVNGYRVGMLISGALALILADRVSWHLVYLFLSFTFVIAGVIPFFAPEPREQPEAPRTLEAAVIEPLIEYFKRRGAIEILLFILLYKIGDVMAANLTTPFYLQVGFTKTEVGAIVKTFGFAAIFVGLFFGGMIMLRWPMKRSLWFFGLLQAVSTLGFALLAEVGKSDELLAAVIAFENLASGMGTSAFVAFIASLTNKRFTAFQYALLSSLTRVAGTVIAAPTGYLQVRIGWTAFFVFCAAMAIPGLLLLLRFPRWQGIPSEERQISD